MQAEVTPPSMQVQNKTGVSAKILFIVEEFLERFTGSLEKKICHQAAVHQPEFVQFVGHGKDKVPMCSINQFPFLGIEPAFNLNFIALWAIAMPAGVVPDFFHMPVRTGLYVPPHGRSAAAHKIIGRFVVMEWQFFALGIVLEGLFENALNRSVHCRPSVGQKHSKVDYFLSFSFPQR